MNIKTIKNDSIFFSKTKKNSTKHKINKNSISNTISNIHNSKLKKIAINLYKKNNIDFLNYKKNIYKMTNYEKEFSNQSNKIIYEIILQLYLIYTGYREMAEIKISKKHIYNGLFEKLMKFIVNYLQNNDIMYELKPNLRDNVVYLYIFHPDSRLNVDNNLGVQTAKKLGEFYTCKTNIDKWLEYKWRIVILVDQVEIYAQMCEKSQIIENISTTMRIYDELKELFKKLDKPKFDGKTNTFRIEIYKITR